MLLLHAGVRVFGLHARDLTGDPAGNKPDPYVKVWCGSAYGGQTEYRKDTTHPMYMVCRVQYGSLAVTCYLNKGTVFYRYELLQ
uniref:C2 domain-containing protein n=1 Tax=Cyprinus carpio TaxID=7962 RepID=A0A8C1GV97_CYPCA